ncbi:MAG: methylmalonyl Co-A mutase-associated GTPase MeaB, partial [Bryobacterales bacterium]|nr:methylmalonyl Co-A mutase-associated GTPase MeaB [Bryobacterales bacterium]
MQAERILAGDVRALARAATAIENRTAEAEGLLAELFPHTGRAMILGITGPPGAGKSTLVDQLARALRAEGKTVGIIAVDPSSPFSGGAILGDRIRMQHHHADGGVFIRSMATRGQMGGLARGTLEMALLLDAAGREAILIETVGVGQDEVEIARLADVTLVVLVPGMGDDVQAIKAGIMEIADVFAINKSDQPGADRLEQELRAMLLLASDHARLDTPIVKTVAHEGKGIAELLAAARLVKDSKVRNSVGLWEMRLREMLRERLLDRMPAEALRAGADAVAGRTANPYQVLEGWLQRWYPPR